MSTKLYNGYRLPKMSLDHLQQFCLQVAKETQNLADILYATELADRATQIIDYAATHDGKVLSSKRYKDTKYIPYSRAWFEVADEQNESKRSETRSSVDYGLEVCLIPGQEFMYAILYGEEKMHGPWISAQGAEAYPYWDNTDPPNGISIEQWHDRRDEWARVLRDSWTPGKVGFTFTLSSNDWLSRPDIRTVRQYVSAFKTRLRRTAEEVLFDEQIKQLGESCPETKPSITLGMDLYRKIREGSEVLAKMEEIRLLLKAVLTVEDFQREYEVINDLS